MQERHVITMEKKISHKKSQLVYGIGIAAIISGAFLGLIVACCAADMNAFSAILAGASCVNLFVFGILLHAFSSIVRASEIFRAEHGDETVFEKVIPEDNGQKDNSQN